MGGCVADSWLEIGKSTWFLQQILSDWRTPKTQALTIQQFWPSAFYGAFAPAQSGELATSSVASRNIRWTSPASFAA